MNKKVTVITCSYNSRKDYFLRVAQALNEQTLAKDSWEYIIVDSGSDIPVRKWLDISWHPDARIIEAPYKSLCRSRYEGMKQASGDLLVFIDDDNVPNEDYLSTSIELMNRYPHIGALGGYIEGEYERPYEEWMKEFLIILCAMEFTNDRKLELQYAYRCNIPESSYFPAGAGLVLRKEIKDYYLKRVNMEPIWLEIGRVGTSLVGSEDADLVWCAIDAGYAIGSSSLLRMKHLIPAHRLEAKYLRKLLYASNYGTGRLLRMRGMKQKLKSTKWCLYDRYLRLKYYFMNDAEKCRYAFWLGYRDGLSDKEYDKRFL